MKLKFLFFSLLVTLSSCGKSRKDLTAAVPPNPGGSVELQQNYEPCNNLAAFDDVKYRPLQVVSEIPVGVYKLKEIIYYVENQLINYTLQVTAKGNRFSPVVNCHKYANAIDREEHNGRLSATVSTSMDLYTKKQSREIRELEVIIKSGVVESAKSKVLTPRDLKPNQSKSQRLFVERAEVSPDQFTSLRFYAPTKNDLVMIFKFEFPSENGKRVIQYNRAVFQRVK